MKIKDKDFVYIALNKPKGYVSALKDNLHPPIIDLITDKVKGLHIVGRLDKDTTGVILLTNDGSFTHQATHPKKHVKKTYLVEAINNVKVRDVEIIQNGMRIDRGKTPLKPGEAQIVGPNKMLLTISEGKFHQVKKMFFALDNEVVNLHRVSFSSVELKDLNLEQGEWKYIDKPQLN